MAYGVSREWVELNEKLLSTEDLAYCQQLIEEERQYKNRKTYLRRIQSRVNRLQARQALEKLDAKTNDN